MLDKSLKVFGLDNNFSLDELEEKYDELLKEFDPENIEDDLKLMFSEEHVKIQEAYHMLLEYYNEKDNVSSVKPIRKIKKLQKKGKKKKRMFLIFLIPICVLLISFIIFFLLRSGEESESILGNNVLTPEIENIYNYEIIKNHDPEWDYIRTYNGDYRVRKKSDPYDAWNEPVEEQLIAVKKVFESAEEKKPCECGCDNENIIENERD